MIEWRRDVQYGRRKAIRLTARGEKTLQELIPKTQRMTNRLVSALERGDQGEAAVPAYRDRCASEVMEA